MDDRVSPGLYLELGDVEPDAYAARAKELAAAPHVHRVSWWATCVPGRSELPMRVRDGTLLGVAEVAERFSAPPAPAGTTAHHFRRHHRPSQGILTGRPTTGLLVVWISPRDPARRQSLRDWGDFVHIRHIAAAAVPGFTQISVYENVTGLDPLFMHFYELDAADPEAAYQAMAAAVAPRLGGADCPAYAHWADYREAGGRLFYCNTFRLIDALPGRCH